MTYEESSQTAGQRIFPPSCVPDGCVGAGGHVTKTNLKVGKIAPDFTLLNDKWEPVQCYRFDLFSDDTKLISKLFRAGPSLRATPSGVAPRSISLELKFEHCLDNAP